MAYSDKYLNSYDRTIADVEAGSDRNVVADYNPIQPSVFNNRDTMEQGIATTLGLFDDDERKNLQRARSLSTIGEVINPAYGVRMAAGDFEDARQVGDGTGMLLSGIGVLPLVGPPLRAAGKSVANVINRTALGTQTNIPDFYSSAIKGKKNFLKAFGKSVPEAIQESVDPAKRAWSAGIYDESRRGWLNPLTDNPPAQQAFKQNDWNHYRIEAIGSNIRTWINDVQCANLVDDTTAEGFIAFQVHSIHDSSLEGKIVKWKNIKILLLILLKKRLNKMVVVAVGCE